MESASTMGLIESKKYKWLGTAQPCDLLRQRVGSQRSGGDDRDLIFVDLRDFFAPDRDQRLARNGLGHFGRESRAVDRQCMSGGNGALARDLQQQRSRPPHFFFQQPGRGVLAVGFQGVRADQFREVRSLMRRR